MVAVSLNDCGDLTYPYESLDGQTKTIKEIIDDTHKLSKEIESAKKPMIIIGESLLRLENAKYLFDNLKDFLNKKNKFSEDWNPLNILSCDAATCLLYTSPSPRD